MNTTKVTRRLQFVKPIAVIVLSAIIENILHDLGYTFAVHSWKNEKTITICPDPSDLEVSHYPSESDFFISLPMKEYDAYQLVDKLSIGTCFDEYVVLTKKVKEQICLALKKWKKPEVKKTKKERRKK
jgi:hypothetical protein